MRPGLALTGQWKGKRGKGKEEKEVWSRWRDAEKMALEKFADNDF